MKPWLYYGSIYVEQNRRGNKKYKVKPVRTCYYCGFNTVIDNSESLPEKCPHCGADMRGEE